ncbi:MAG TPA: tRNA pseudouridine(13) synthase TruD [Myxococcota bacterium]|jgi:tRNA pseudouridine13 synthase|nr:tRNA pseudouridine(13) synthase TruD [Myxococcota bacterium]
MAPPLLTGALPGTGGTLKDEPDDFIVEEVPAYEPNGAGDHLWLWVEKRDVEASALLDRLAAALGVRHTELGAAGRKDRRAVTRQWVSAPLARGRAAPEAEAIDAGPGVRVLRVARHANKLRTGHLRGNRFIVRIRDVESGADVALQRARAKLQLLEARGLPNGYGEQRFGGGAAQLAFGHAVLKGEARAPRDKRRARFLLSAVQGDLFNRYLAARMTRGLWGRALAGDVMKKEDTGGIFVCTDPAADQARLDALAIHPTGPMYGEEMRAAEGEAAALEAEVLAGAGLGAEDLARVRRLAAGTRRPLRVLVREVAVRADERDGRADLVAAFFLPKGSYATVLLRELMHPSVLPAGGAGPALYSSDP